MPGVPPVQATPGPPVQAPKVNRMTDKTDADKDQPTSRAELRKADDKAAAESNQRREEIANDERDPSQPRHLERTPRDVAINKAKQGQDTGLETSRPDKTERFRVPGRFVSQGQFEDFDGRLWKIVSVKESQATRLNPEAVRKDGGDPHLLGVASAEPRQIADDEIVETSVVATRTGNMQPSEDPVQAPKDRARIANEDGPSARPSKALDAQAKAAGQAEGAEEGKASRKPRARANKSEPAEKPSKLARVARTLRHK